MSTLKTKVIAAPVNGATVEKLNLQTNNLDRVTVDENGNVGFGTTAPLDKLHLSSPGATYVRVENSATGIRTFFGQSSTGTYIGSSQNTPVQLVTNNLTRVQVGEQGQLGIGGANYGTAGQVLTSNGASAAPSWTTISTTPPTTYGEVGTYVVAYGGNGSGYTVGSTESGSTLTYVSGTNGTGGLSVANAGSTSEGTFYPRAGGRAHTSMGLSGTWRCMTQGGAGVSTMRQIHLWVRVV